MKRRKSQECTTQVLVLLSLLSWCTCGTLPPSPQCPSAPPHAQPADAHYRLRVSGEPDLFLPGELYTVNLEGMKTKEGPTPFIGFTIWAELLPPSDVITSPTYQPSDSASNQSLGTFQVYEAQTKNMEECEPAVTNATGHTKVEVQVIWNTPQSAVDICVRLCAQVGPAERAKEKWSTLARKICAAPASLPNFARQPAILEPCCACDEAKYEVVFESLWSRNTHPRGFPTESARAHFDDLIGASHTAQYRVWQEGRVASSGLKRLADDGATTQLEKELKSESDHIRTIIKTRGISWQQLSAGGNPSTFAVFRVDPKNHLLSLVTKLAPSPDWIVGVSALELCNSNCTWTNFTTLSLFPYDAGTDSGIRYTSPRHPTIPAVPVRALRPDWPKNNASPFYSPTGDMRPFARLRLTRLGLYEKNCVAQEVSSQQSPDSAAAEAGSEMSRGGGEGGGGGGAGVAGAGAGSSCAVTGWGAWGACSVSCGRGRVARQRHYVSPPRAARDSCRQPLTQHRRCYGPRRHCRAPTEYEPDPAESTGPCAVSPWSAWSPCEGCGIRVRTRHYLRHRAFKKCHVGFKARTILHQAMPCDEGLCEFKGKPPGTFDSFFVDTSPPDCPVSPWGEWTPCAGICGRGKRIRTRLILASESTVQQEVSRRQLRDWTRRLAELNHQTVHVDNITTVDPELDKKVNQLFLQCDFTMTIQEALCGEDNDCSMDRISADVCKLPREVGHCRGYEERWFHHSATAQCEPFGYSGCGGNSNNFRTYALCASVCMSGNHVASDAENSTGAVAIHAKDIQGNDSID